MPSSRHPASGEEWDFEVELGTIRSLERSDQEIQVYLSERVRQEIWAYARTNMSKELGGVLLGIPEDTNGLWQVRITAALKAKKTHADRTSVTFTHETWTQIHHEMEILYPELSIVGWFHTHPGFGVFLSKHDLFIHQNFFNLPWHLAYVVDPMTQQHGFFAWKNDEILPVDMKTLEQEEMGASHETEKDFPRPPAGQSRAFPSSSRMFRRSFYLGAALVVSLILLMGTNVPRMLFEPSPSLEARLEEKEATIQNLSDQLIEAEEEIQRLDAEVGELEKWVEELSGDRFFVYRVRPGDSLWSISRQFYDDPAEYAYLMRLNNLQDPDRLRTGQQLLLYRAGD